MCAHVQLLYVQVEKWNKWGCGDVTSWKRKGTTRCLHQNRGLKLEHRGGIEIKETTQGWIRAYDVIRWWQILGILAPVHFSTHNQPYCSHHHTVTYAKQKDNQQSPMQHILHLLCMWSPSVYSMQTCDRFWEGAFIAWAANNGHMEFVRALVVTLHLRLGAFQLSQLDSGPVTLL